MRRRRRRGCCCGGRRRCRYAPKPEPLFSAKPQKVQTPTFFKVPFTKDPRQT